MKEELARGMSEMVLERKARVVIILPVRKYVKDLEEQSSEVTTNHLMLGGVRFLFTYRLNREAEKVGLALWMERMTSDCFEFYRT